MANSIENSMVEKKGADKLSEKDATKYKSIAARINYPSKKRADIKTAAMNICRSMSCPMARDWAMLERAAEYLQTYPKVECTVLFQILLN